MFRNWQSIVFYTTMVCAFALLGAGLHRVLVFRRSCLVNAEQTRQVWLNWHQQIAGEMSLGGQRQWLKVAEKHPEMLLRGCVQKMRQTGDEVTAAQ